VSAPSGPLYATQSPEPVPADHLGAFTVTVSVTAVGLLVAAALNDLAQADAEDDGCCPVCCGPCSALHELALTGQLDLIVRDIAPGYEWWDATVGWVNRGWLDSAWRMTSCHEPVPDCDCNRSGVSRCEVTRGVGYCPCVCHDGTQPAGAVS
jgi:hypothetical protein